MKLALDWVASAALLVVCIICYGVAEVRSDVDPRRNFTRSRYSNWNSTTEVPVTTSTTDTISLAEKLLSIDDSEELEPIEKQKCGEKIGENHPWIAVIEHSDPLRRSRKKTVSKGVLIDLQHVLTTVSSIHNSHPFWTVSHVRLGDTPTWGAQHDRSATVRIAVDAIYNHQLRDIAIVRLAHPVQVSDVISPICLPTVDIEPKFFHNPELHRCVRAAARSASQLPLVTVSRVQTVFQNDCRIMFARKGGQLADDEMCAWDERRDTCTRDLGGPLNVKINGRYHVVALNSFVKVASELTPEDFPGVYTRVGAHLQWIQAVLDLEDP